MPARHKQKKVWRVQAFCQTDRQRMAFEVIDSREREAMDERNRLRRHKPGQETADEARPGGRGNAGEIAELKARFGERRLYQTVQNLHMRASRDFRHHAAIGRVIIKLRPHNIRKDYPVPFCVAPDNCGRSFIAACLNTKYG